MSILEQLTDYAKERVKIAKTQLSLDKLMAEVSTLPRGDFVFEQRIKKRNLIGEIAFICECKKASPSKGIIDPVYDYLDIARAYDAAKTDCISVLTEPKWFLGSDKHLHEIAKAVSAPCLRKDFVVDDYQIYEAKLLGTQAVLLICSILSDAQIKHMLELSNELGLSALVEAHDSDEVKRALDCGARMIGVNNRNLKDFSVDTSNSRRLRTLVPDDIIFVSESGVKDSVDVKNIVDCGANAILVGEAMMRSQDKSAMLQSLRSYKEV
ncbi:indole-3-glycerol phosphate synthase TrpC [uncultured Anaerobiospirillum sp.]|uniref:indole-3-glycerol phosphate synthase TrpC n=1 Tax=uncultured Anaerobiospirillum sp. TaxID=265728 RepID=UPI002806492F|nr:indole-3-glycerol phosphate synthase TrpC [uncultured Anaerobiospirillum sp.]